MRAFKFRRAKKMMPIKGIQTTHVVDMAKEGTLMPPAPGLCQKCATDHREDEPHNQQSLFWQYWFYRESGGRWPTWRDAIAHCSEEAKEVILEFLKEMGIDPGPAREEVKAC